MPDGIRVDFTGVETGNYKPIPAGTYHAKITGGELREAGENAKHPGSSYINWEFTIQDGEHEGRKQWMNTSLLPEALFGLKGLLEATGKFDVNGPLDFDIESCIGCDVKIKVRVKTYKGEQQNEVKRVISMTDDDSTTSSVLP